MYLINIRVSAFWVLLFLCSTSMWAQQPVAPITQQQIKKNVQLFVDNWVNTDAFPPDYNFHQHHFKGTVKLSSLHWNNASKRLTVVFSKELSERPFRTKSVQLFESKLRTYLPDSVREAKLVLSSNGKLLRQLIPNYYRHTSATKDQKRFPKAKSSRPKRQSVVTRNKPYTITAGLQNSNLALWNSHGWYYEGSMDRWEWQRARLFTTVEDLLPTAFVVPLLMPMLENAGATVFSPRERDWQVQEIIVDNNTADSLAISYSPNSSESAPNTGFAIGKTPYTTENPFRQGTYITTTDSVVYKPSIPEKGEYGVHVSYGKGKGKAMYTVYYEGGKAQFIINQAAAFGTWIYLGRFRFNADTTARVVVQPIAGQELSITTDAVRFGGGMGVIERNGQLSGRAKFYEGARYYMQYAGAPGQSVWNLSAGKNDYKDDYQGRGEWVNWLMGAPYGPSKHASEQGLNVSVDLALAFHTDAGQQNHDSIVGTLTIHSTKSTNQRFSDGQSKFTSRDLADIVQSQIVDDITTNYQIPWTRRGIWDKGYSEAARPKTPTMLLELLSHQNLNDMRFALHPQFRFDVARSVYKGMLRYLAYQHNYDYVVQPLPINCFEAELTDSNTVKLAWEPVPDPLETSATPTHYMVYQRIGDSGFGAGRKVENSSLEISGLQENTIYSYRITAVNTGGESFPSEVMSVGIASSSNKKAIIINGFDRIDGPSSFETRPLSGILAFRDNGVAYNYDLATTGQQYDFDRKSPWIDDDSPGHGASYANQETTVTLGNNFDFAAIHGQSLLAAGYSFTTTSDEAVEDNSEKLNQYQLVDWLLGEEKTTIFPGKNSKKHFEIYTNLMLTALEKYQTQGGKIFLSGAYLGTDIGKSKQQIERVGKLFQFKWRTGHAALTGQFSGTLGTGTYETQPNLTQYAVEAPDAIEPYSKTAKTALRYTENNMSAAVIQSGKTVALAFPFESVKGKTERLTLLKALLKALDL